MVVLTEARLDRDPSVYIERDSKLKSGENVSSTRKRPARASSRARVASSACARCPYVRSIIFTLVPISRASSKIETPAASASIHPSVPAYGAFVLDPDGHNVEVVNHNQG
jgi:hypothetical protein